MLAQVVVFGNVQRQSKFGRAGKIGCGAEEDTAEGKAGNVLEDVGVFNGLGGIFAPRKRSMAGYQHAGDGEGVEILQAEAADDDRTRVVDVGLDYLGGGEGLGHGNGTVKVVGMGGAEAGNGASGLGPRGGEFGVGVNDAADLGKLAIEHGVGVQVAGRSQRAFYDVAVEVRYHEVGGSEGGVIYAAGLDDDKGLRTGTVDATGVAEGVGSQAAAGDLLVGVEDLFAKGS
jgi:hypothetical protein